jgi:hypothetical protein
MWIHKKSGYRYIVLNRAIMKSPSGWVPCVIYMKDDMGHEVYVREREEFLRKFEETPRG